MDIIKLIADHTLIFALIFVIGFIAIRFYFYPKFRDSGKDEEEKKDE